jgi:hypothetical protein
VSTVNAQPMVWSPPVPPRTAAKLAWSRTPANHTGTVTTMPLVPNAATGCAVWPVFDFVAINADGAR